MIQAHQPKDTWENIEGAAWQLKPVSEWVQENPKRILQYTVAMYPESFGQPGLSLCANGEFDSHYQKLADNLVAHGLQKTILRVGWEFSGNWMPWSAIGLEILYAACFRRIVETMRLQQPEGKFEFEWSGNFDMPAEMFEKTYPGDEFVDYIGLSIYDRSWYANTYPLPADCDEDCKLKRRSWVWSNSLEPGLKSFAAFARMHNKRLAIPEWGLADGANRGGDDNTLYIQNMSNFIKDPANNVAYHSYFDVVSMEGLVHQISGATPHVESAKLFKEVFLFNH